MVEPNRAYALWCLGAFVIAVLGLSPRGTGSDEPPLQLRVGLARPGAGASVVTMPLETYVARVLAGEAARDSQPAALEALAIAIRTFALANRGRHRADRFDVCDQTHCQVVGTATPATSRAAQATAGRILLSGREVANVYYSASCGGRTERPSAVWPGHDDPSYLPSREDAACGGAPAWVAQLREADVLRALRAAGFRGERLRQLRIVSRNGSGRATRLRIDGLEPDRISGQDLRVAVGRSLGWQHIKSTAFELRKEGDVYRFSGHGSGHGVGMCVVGSARLAADGRDAAHILGRYYPGLKVSAPGAGTEGGRRRDAGGTEEGRRRVAGGTDVAATPEVMVALPDDDAGEQATIVKLTLRARDQLAQTLGVAPPPRVTLRFHSTTDAYERVTGRPWFTSAAVVNQELHLLPLAILRERGVLDRTIRHELVHMMTDGVLARRPAWVREGAAIYFASERLTPDPRASCPGDNELLRPVSAGALTNAYARARACFARQIASGKAWQDVK